MRTRTRPRGAAPASLCGGRSRRTRARLWTFRVAFAAHTGTAVAAPQVRGLGPFSAYNVSGYSQHDECIFPKPGFFISSPLADYELGEPSKVYAPLLAPLTEKAELCKRIVRSEPNQPLPRATAHPDAAPKQCPPPVSSGPP